MTNRLRQSTGIIFGQRLVACWLWLLIFTSPAHAAERQRLRGHVPAAVEALNLQPKGQLAAANHLQLAIGLPLRYHEALASLLAQIYDPASPQYHGYLAPEQFAERFGPAEEDYQAVIAFAEAQGLKVTARHPNRVLLDVSGSVADIEKAFHVTLRLYPHPGEARAFYAPDVEPSLDLGVPVLSVSGLNDYVLPHPNLRAAPVDQLAKTSPLLGSGPSGTYMGNDFRRAYVPNVSLTGAGQVVGLLEFDGFYAKDITAYEHLAGLPKVSLKEVTLDGFNGKPGNGNVEVALDIEVALSMAPGLSQIIVYEAGPSGNWHDILNRMATDNLAKQLSCSWYSPGQGADPVADQIFQQMAAQGQSFFDASGDYDAYTGLISFPGDTSYVTQVGGTTLSMTANGGAYVSETVWNWDNGIGSGGGISTQYLIPSWQRNVNLSANHGSARWRNIPDVAMTADHVFVIADNGQQLNVGGTSCAAPLWAAFIALVNQHALANGKPAVGFINPAVYAIGAGPNYGAAFHDITTGDNTSASSPTEFLAVPGYDLCTGWGTPAGQELIVALAGTDGLSITGASGFVAGGPVGGPFNMTTQTFALANLATTTLSWQASKSSSWLTVTPTSGALSSNQPPVTVTVSLNSAASNLNAGFYPGTVWFTNTSTAFIQARQFALAVAQGSYGGTVLALNPVAYWQLNETNRPPAADVATNAGSLGAIGNGLGFAGPLQGEPGIVGQCFRFSNSNLDSGYFGSHVDMPYNAASNPSGPFTVELWAKPARVVSDLFCPAASVDASQNGGLSRFGWIFYQTPASTWEFRVGGFNGYVLTNSSGSAEIGAWNHLVGVYDGANASFYVNGQLVEGPSVATGFSPNTNNTIPLRLGATTLTNRTFDGWVDEVAFYANALGADRIAAHYNTASSDVSGYAAQVLADQPLGYWHLDEPAYATPGGLLPGALNLGWLGSAANGLYEPGALPGVPGVPSPVFGQSNYACQLNGPGYIDMAGWALNFTGPLSLALWIKANPANGSLQTIASKGASSYRLILDGTGHPRFADGGQPSGDVIGPARIDDGAWHQLIGVYDGANTESLYVDGQLAASTNGATAAVAGNGSDFLIGVNPDEALVPLFNGVVDEVCIFTNALSAAQVQQLFLAAIPALPAPPVFQRITHVGGAVLLTWSAVAGKVYQVQYNTALTQTNWNNLGNAITATNSALSASDVMPGSQRFYRVLLLR